MAVPAPVLGALALGVALCAAQEAACSAREVVVLDFSLLNSGVPCVRDVEAAFGVHGLGILAVRDVPGVDELRRALLPLASAFAQLSDATKANYTHEASHYAFGWSHGKEKLQGRPDEAKGSFYANPQFDRPVDDAALIARYPAFIHPNLWPHQELPQLRPAFRSLGQRLVEVGTLLATQVDQMVQAAAPGYASRRLEDIIRRSKCAKGRLLHYFARSEEAGPIAEGEADDTRFSDWCGWHNDHGSLTALVPPMYLDAAGKEVPNPDPEAGLYIRDRNGTVVKAEVPDELQNYVFFQIGETAQIHSGGVVQATPHAVRGLRAAGISRETFAVFMEPCWDEIMDVPPGRGPEDAQSSRAADSLPQGVPRLASRWQPGIDFGTFTENTLGAYY